MPNQSRAPNNDDGSGIEDREKRRRADLWEQTTNKARKVFNIKHSKRSFGISLCGRSSFLPRTGPEHFFLSCSDVPMDVSTNLLLFGRGRSSAKRRLSGLSISHARRRRRTDPSSFSPFSFRSTPPPGSLFSLEEERRIG